MWKFHSFFEVKRLRGLPHTTSAVKGYKEVHQMEDEVIEVVRSLYRMQKIGDDPKSQYSVIHLLVVDVSCVLLWTQSACMVQ